MHIDAFQALSDPTRRRIVETLRRGEQQVGDTVDLAGIHQSGVSRHLRILHESGFVTVRPDGQRRLYSLRPEPFRQMDDWLSPYRDLGEKRLDRLGDPWREGGRTPNQPRGAVIMNEAKNLVVERTYRATVQELWELWTTKDGFESWWGPEGFRVEVQEIDPRVGGTIRYDMIADAPEMIAEMKKMGQPLSHKTRGTFSQVELHRRLTLTHVIDFIPGVKPYESTMAMELFPSGGNVRMVVHLSAMHDAQTRRKGKAIGHRRSSRV